MKLTGRLLVYVVAVAIVLTTVLGLMDVLFTQEPMTFGDVATDFFELLVLSAAMVMSIVIVERMRGLEDATSRMQAELSEAAAAGRAWRAQSEQLLAGLGAAIADQFKGWGLSDAEAEIAGLILKGVALKDIAALRRTSEATIRQQAQSIYRKSGLANRAELSAFFLEDLFDVGEARVSPHYPAVRPAQ